MELNILIFSSFSSSSFFSLLNLHVLQMHVLQIIAVINFYVFTFSIAFFMHMEFLMHNIFSSTSFYYYYYCYYLSRTLKFQHFQLCHLNLQVFNRRVVESFIE